MGILGKRALFETLRSINSATFTGALQALGTPLLHPSVLMKIVNNSTVAVTISYDGVNDNDIVPANGFVLYDFGSDAQDVSGDSRLAFGQGTQVYVRSEFVGVGSVYLVTVYVGG